MVAGHNGAHGQNAPLLAEVVTHTDTDTAQNLNLVMAETNARDMILNLKTATFKTVIAVWDPMSLDLLLAHELAET